MVVFDVGSIEAEVTLLSQLVSFSTLKVIGVKLTSNLNEGVTAINFTLTLTKILRDHDVVGMLIESFWRGTEESVTSR
ncbi:MAG: aconitase family protein [Candidatus Micrarchaeaceae archaeon]